MLIQQTSIWLTTHSFIKTSSGPRKYFFYLLQCCLFNSYVTFSKDNPNSHISFLDFMADIIENLIHTLDAVSSPSSTSDEAQGSSRTPTPTPPKHAPKNEPPPGRLDGKLKNHKLVHIPPTKSDKTRTRKCPMCVRKNIKKETRFLCAQCSVPLHPEGCYTCTHNITLKHYWRYVLNFKSLSHIVFV